MSEFQQTWFTVPKRIMDLEGLTMAFLRIYETIFQFWNNGKSCYLSNAMITERTGITSESTIREAFIFFEKHNEITRKTKNGRRYFVQPTQYVEEEQELSTDSSTKIVTPVGESTPYRRKIDAPPVGESTHKNNNINTNKLNKSSCVNEVQKQNKPVDKSKYQNEKKHDWNSKPNELKSTVKEWGPGHPSYDSMYGVKNVQTL